ncbi:hypothetical protein LRC39_07315 [Rhodopseudomonas sp. P1]|uniref:hypothetical protein n=1 Tax=Rhodopseudomonas sp. P1 TaxID=3434357 RepID=UPI0031FD22B6
MNLLADHVAPQASVMAGLDPAIHPASQNVFPRAMDRRAFAAPKGLRPRRRVKPGGDSHHVEMPS